MIQVIEHLVLIIEMIGLVCVLKGINKQRLMSHWLYLSKLEQEEAQYNFLFVLNTKNKYYCTDMVSRAYESIQTESGKQKIRI